MKRKISRVLLIAPPFHRFFGISNSFLPIGLLSIGTVLRQNGYIVKVYNSDFERKRLNFDHPFTKALITEQEEYKRRLYNLDFYVWREIRETIKYESPDVVGIGFTSDRYVAACKIAEIVKNIDKNILVLVGGPHSTALPEETIVEPFFDILVRGEGEDTVLDLLKNIEQKRDLTETEGITFKKDGQIISTPQKSFLVDLDEIPIYDRSLLIAYDEYYPYAMGNIVTSRGCPYNCNFCSTNILWGKKVRYRSVSSVVNEIEYIHKKYHTIDFSLLDDVFTLDKNRILDFCEELKKRKLKIYWTCLTRTDLLTYNLLKEMKSAGCKYVSVGIETGDPLILEKTGKNIILDNVGKIVKDIKKLKMQAHGYFIVGFPDETEESLEKTSNLIYTLGLDYISIAFLVPYPRTQIYIELLKKEKLLTNDWSDYFPENPYIFLRDYLSNKILAESYLRLKKYSAWLKALTLRKESHRPIYIYRKLNESLHSSRHLMGNIRKFLRLHFNRTA